VEVTQNHDYKQNNFKLFSTRKCYEGVKIDYAYSTAVPQNMLSVTAHPVNVLLQYFLSRHQHISIKWRPTTLPDSFNVLSSARCQNQTLFNAILCLYRIAWPWKSTPRIKQHVATYHTTKVIARWRPKSELYQTATQNWLPWQRPSAPADSHLTHDALGPSKPTTQMAFWSV